MTRASPSHRKAYTLSDIAAALGPQQRGVLITPDGKSRRVLLEESGVLFLFNRRSRRWGRRLYLDADLPPEWRARGVIVRPCPDKEERAITRLRRVAQAVLRCTPDDVWPELRADAIVLLAAIDRLSQAAAHDLSALTAAFASLQLQVLPWGARITTLRSQGAEKRHIQTVVAAFRQRRSFQVAWRGKYDCTAWGRRDPDGHYRAFLATEYRGMSNGHYWALLNGTHAVYLESDEREVTAWQYMSPFIPTHKHPAL